MEHRSGAFVGIDTSKLRNAVAVAEEGRGGEVRYFGEIDTTEAATRKLVTKLAAKCCRHYPGAAAGRIPSLIHPTVSAFPERVAGSACTSSFSRFARR